MFPAGVHAKVGNADILRWVHGSEKDIFRSVHKACVRSKNLAEDQEVNDKGRSNIPGILVGDIGVMVVLHVIQHGFGDKNKVISFSLLSLGDEGSKVPRYCHGISFLNVARLAETFKSSLPTASSIE